MQQYSSKHYAPIAVNDFIVFADNMPLLVIYDKDDRSLREKNIKFHIKANDYFGTLATVIGLIIQEKQIIEARQNKILHNLKDDLVFLQENYKIVKKKNNEIKAESKQNGLVLESN